jgi:hypothetical protein
MRPDYEDLVPGDFGEQLEPYDWVGLKYDGLYAEFIGDSEGWSIHGRNGDLLRYGYEPTPDCYLRGELIEGTEWAKGSPIMGHWVAWDVIYLNGAAPEMYYCRDCPDVSMSLNGALHEINSATANTGLFVHKSSHLPSSDAALVWKDRVLGEGFEGLVFRSADGQRYGRMKRVVTADYVVTGYREQGPRVTALYGGLLDGSCYRTVCTVPVKSPAEQAALWAIRGHLQYRVFEAAGNAVHKSGALRHPRQAGEGGAVKWRPDKAASECVL